MSKTINMVFQDCPKCFGKKEWLENGAKIAGEHGCEFKPLNSQAPEAKQIIRDAHNHGVELPFFYDGTTASREIEVLVGAGKPKQAKKGAKEKEDGTV